MSSSFEIVDTDLYPYSNVSTEELDTLIFDLERIICPAQDKLEVIKQEKLRRHE